MARTPRGGRKRTKAATLASLLSRKLAKESNYKTNPEPSTGETIIEEKLFDNLLGAMVRLLYFLYLTIILYLTHHHHVVA